MAVTYRKMSLADQDSVFDLRMRMWGAPSRECVKAGTRLDPLYLDHTFVALDADGTLLSTVRYWLREIRDAEGKPRRVGCVASVATIERARRQGHARKLMEMAIASMRDDGCEWSLLLSSKMGVSLYESLGYRAYPAPFYDGVLSTERSHAIPGVSKYSVERIGPPFDIEAPDWQAARRIHAHYNAARPLSLVRDDSYWRGYLARRLSHVHEEYRIALFLARAEDGSEVGYLLAYYSTQELAQREFQMDQRLPIDEIGILRGHEGAGQALLSAAIQAAASGRVIVSAVLPHDEVVKEAMQSLPWGSLRRSDRGRMMALPISPDFSEAEIAALFAAPGAVFWATDYF